MPAPLPPVVDGPIYAVPGVPVKVDNVLPDALVKVLQDGSEIGHATSTSPGFIWVPTTIDLVATKRITATQTYTGSAGYIDATPGEASDPSIIAVIVAAVPESLPVPVFLSGLTQCTDSVWLGDLIPGATVSISQGSTHLGGGVAETPTQWFPLSGPEPAAGQSVQAVQEIHKVESPIGESALVAPTPASLPRPVIALPVRDCQTFIDLSGMIPGANVEVTNGGFTDTGTSPASAYTGDLQPLTAGPLQAWQYFGRCQDPPASPKALVTVGTSPLPRPEVGYAVCPSLRQLTVHNLVRGEILTVSAVTETGGSEAVTVIGPQGVSGTTATVSLSSLPADTVALRLSVTLCGLVETGPPDYVTVPVSTASGPTGPPDLVAPLYDCARSVTVTGAYPGCLLTVFSGSITNVLATPIVATAPEMVIGLWTGLVQGEQVSVAQTGCHASGQSKPVTVIAPPPVPVPTIVRPVLSDATSVTVTGVLPGAQVFLYVDGVFRSQVDAVSTTASLPVGTGGLAQQSYVEVTEELCGKVSTRTDSGPGYAPIQAPAPRPSGGLKGNSGYFFEDSCNKLTGVNVTITVTEGIGGTGSAYTGFGFQLNCWSWGQGDVNAWQQFAIIIDPSGTSSPGIVALANSWPFNWDGSIHDFVLDNQVTLAPLSTASLPGGYQFTISLTTESTTDNVKSATFQATDLTTSTTYPPQTITLVGLADNLTPGHTITEADLAPIAAFQLLLVGPDDSAHSVLTTGAGHFTISATNELTATNAVPTACTQFDSPGTAEDANSVYSELPATPSQTFVQQFSVS